MQNLESLEIIQEWIICHSNYEELHWWCMRALVLFAGFLFDALFGDPHWLWHPVQGIGWWITTLEKMLWKVFRIKPEEQVDQTKKMLAGGILVILVIMGSLLPPAFLLYWAKEIHPVVYLILESVFCYQLLAMHSLWRESSLVAKALEQGGIEAGRKQVSMIVGRDTAKLTEEGVLKATVETIAENTSDGIIAPLFYMAIFGPLGGFAYKAINTMDSMIGYKNQKYFYFGRIAAKLDDVINYLPARISAGFMLLAVGMFSLVSKKMSLKQAWRIYRRDRRKTASPNAGQTEAVVAGALGVCLGGEAYYFGKLHKKNTLGDALRVVERRDIARTNGLMLLTTVLVLLAAEVLLWLPYLI